MIVTLCLDIYATVNNFSNLLKIMQDLVPLSFLQEGADEVCDRTMVTLARLNEVS